MRSISTSASNLTNLKMRIKSSKMLLKRLSNNSESYKVATMITADLAKRSQSKQDLTDMKAVKDRS